MYDVLIVEDDPMVLSINKRYVENVHGFNIKAEAKTEKEALLLITKYNFDLLLIDIHLPSKSGLDLIKMLRKREFSGDFIIITAEGREETIQLCAKYGAIDYILKPFQFDRFQESLIRFKQQKEWLSNHQTINQEVIDKYYRNIGPAEQKGDLPYLEKGITKQTLQLILSVIDDLNNEFTIDQLTEESNLSHVSVRKYVKYLEDHGLLKPEQKYGTIGRPVTYYYKIS